MADALRRPVHELSAAELMAEAQRRTANRAAGRPLDAPALVCADSPEDVERRDLLLEKEIVARADKQLRALGFCVWNLSQPRATKMTPGIPDRLYTNPARGVALFWEAKTDRGQQRPDQRFFQEHADSTGLNYVLGTERVLYEWLVARGVAVWAGYLLTLAEK